MLVGKGMTSRVMLSLVPRQAGLTCACNDTSYLGLSRQHAPSITNSAVDNSVSATAMRSVRQLLPSRYATPFVVVLWYIW